MFRPVLSRGETIDSCCSEDLVTVLEMKVEKKPFKVTDRLRLYRKGIMAATLKELLEKGDKNITNIEISNIEFQPEINLELKTGWKFILSLRRMTLKWMMRIISKLLRETLC